MFPNFDLSLTSNIVEFHFTYGKYGSRTSLGTNVANSKCLGTVAKNVISKATNVANLFYYQHKRTSNVAKDLISYYKGR